VDRTAFGGEGGGHIVSPPLTVLWGFGHMYVMRICGPKSNVYDIWLKSVKISPTNFLYDRTEKEIMQGTMPGARRRERPHTAWMENIKAWTGLSVEESVSESE